MHLGPIYTFFWLYKQISKHFTQPCFAIHNNISIGGSKKPYYYFYNHQLQNWGCIVELKPKNLASQRA